MLAIGAQLAIVLFYFLISVIIIAHIIVKHLEKNPLLLSANFIFSRIIIFPLHDMSKSIRMSDVQATHVKQSECDSVRL